uniref:Uncharacterized protein n=1 Tax=viral metagenome TaxID=1070528 RepID=A0A6M3LSD0_9ZZZZ
MGGDIGLTNHRLLGRSANKDYDISWYLEEDYTHPNDMNIVKITICNGKITQDKRSYPIAVLQSIETQLKII